MRDREPGGPRLIPAVLAGAALLVFAGCASTGSSYGAPSDSFAQSLGCTASEASETLTSEERPRKPPEGTDACAVIADRGVPDRVDRMRVGATMYQNWLYRDLTIVIRNPDCPGGTCADGSVWEVVYSG